MMFAMISPARDRVTGARACEVQPYIIVRAYGIFDAKEILGIRGAVGKQVSDQHTAVPQMSSKAQAPPNSWVISRFVCRRRV